MSEEIKYPCEQIAINFFNSYRSLSSNSLCKSFALMMKKELQGAYLAGKADALKEGRRRIVDVLKYCKPHTEMMWAASIIAIILDCEFRDSKEEIDLYFKEISQPKNEFFKDEGFSNE